MPNTTLQEGTNMARRAVLVLLTILASLLLAGWSAAGCGEGFRHVQLQDRPGLGISFAKLWLDVAEAAKCDPNSLALESMSLEFSESGRLQQALINAVTEQSQHLQVFLSDKTQSGADSLECGVSISPPEQAWANHGVTAGAPLFQAIDLVGPSSMIALLEPANSGGFYSFTSAYGTTSPLQPISSAALAYRWDGAHFVQLAPGDELRQFPGGYEYIVGDTAQLVSTSSTDNTITWEHQGSGVPVYFVIPAMAGL